MRIWVIDTFLDEKTRYEIGSQHDVEDKKGFYFVMNGWAQDLDAKETVNPVADAVDLDIQNSTIGMKDTNG